MPISRKTLDFLSEEIIRILSRGDQTKDSQYDDRAVAEMIKDVSAQICIEKYFQNKKQGINQVDSHFIYVIPAATIANDATYGKNYVDIGAEYVSLPRQEGIQRVIFDDGDEAIPLPHNSLSLISALPSGSMDTEWTYEVVGNRIYFNTNGGVTALTDGKTTARIDIVSVHPFNANTHPDASYENTDAYDFPPDLREEVKKRVLERYGWGLQIPRDERNDNSIMIQ